MCDVQLLRESVHERISAAAEDFLLQLEKGGETARVPELRAMLTERLTAAAEEIVAVFEDRMERSEREICRQRRLLEAVMKPQLRLHRVVCPADVQPLMVNKEEVPPEQQQWSPLVDQEDRKPPHIKEGQEELLTKPQSGLNTKNNKQPLSDMKCKTGKKAFGCSECGKRFRRNCELTAHMRIHTRETPISCSECGQGFRLKGELTVHMRTHKGEKQISCSECGQGFRLKGELTVHMKTHKGEKHISCSECGQGFRLKGELSVHMKTHKGEKPMSCSECGRRFARKFHLTMHMREHTAEKPYIGKRRMADATAYY
ncbi:gastrula zinc finger protein XlCGF8.2DB-like [Limanda limanda]|uniref:gastrula zinc finger protein XlCGF8.2DB-like n=1 Tax=Limanda limanda TaxID=27771 RepID=UPI0029C6119A|nr:gastrula zinc finger protein XlCGF8.2DB-like [Limanda limanda]